MTPDISNQEFEQLYLAGRALRSRGYRGRLAPSPTGYLHLGHAKTFWIAQQRAIERGGILVLRNEDIDRERSRKEFVDAMFEDLEWVGLRWPEGADKGGPCGPYNQSERTGLYRAAFEILRQNGFVYPCTCSRRDVAAASSAPNLGDEEPIYPGTCRENLKFEISDFKMGLRQRNWDKGMETRGERGRRNHVNINWRFRVPDGEVIGFVDGCMGEQRFVAGKDFGDFVVWKEMKPTDDADDADDSDEGGDEEMGNASSFAGPMEDRECILLRRAYGGQGVHPPSPGLRRTGNASSNRKKRKERKEEEGGVPSYQLAVVVDDGLMGISEVVRGADLLVSTARQLLLYRALGFVPPDFYHAPLVLDEQGVRLAKRHDAMSLRRLRAEGVRAEEIVRRFDHG